MKKIIKITAAILSAVMIFGFASCTPSVSDDGNDRGTEKTNPATPKETTTPTVPLSSIEVSGTPTNALYYPGDSLDTSGLTVTATYSDGSTKTVTDFTTSGFSSESVSLGTEQTLTICYIEGSVTKTATVNGTFYVAAADVKPTESPVPVYKDWYLESDGYFYAKCIENRCLFGDALIITVTKKQ